MECVLCHLELSIQKGEKVGECMWIKNIDFGIKKFTVFLRRGTKQIYIPLTLKTRLFYYSSISRHMNQAQDILETYPILMNENPRLTTLKAKYNTCVNKLNRNKMNPGYLTIAQEEELKEKLYVIKQLLLAHE